MEDSDKQEVLAVLALYGLRDKNLSVVKDTNGFVNKIFFISIGRKKWVLRKSHRATLLEHIKLEVRLLGYLQKHKFSVTPRVILNLRGKNITTYRGAFFTLQTFMPGDMKASWNNLAPLNDAMFGNFFKKVASFSRAVEKFPATRSMPNRPLGYYASNGRKLFAELYRAIPKSEGKLLLAEHREKIRNFFHNTKAQFTKTRYDALPKQLVHFDWHPGNVHFKGNKIAALFDFDWARYDSRLSDLASAIGQSCYYYGGKHGGTFRKDRIKNAVTNYQKSYGKSEFNEEKENELIKTALEGFVLYLLLWAVEYYKDNCQPASLAVLEHFIKTAIINDFDKLFS